MQFCQFVCANVTSSRNDCREPARARHQPWASDVLVLSCFCFPNIKPKNYKSCRFMMPILFSLRCLLLELYVWIATRTLLFFSTITAARGFGVLGFWGFEIFSFFSDFFRSNSFIFERKVKKIYMGVFSTHFVPLISILAPKIMEVWNIQLWKLWFLQDTKASPILKIQNFPLGMLILMHKHSCWVIMPEACNNCFMDPHNWFTKPERSEGLVNQ